MFDLRYSEAAAKTLAKLSIRIARAVHGELVAIASGPRRYRGDWKPLHGSAYWRLRVGAYRAICEVCGNELLILVLKIGARGDVYK